jgi:5-methylcytosine-specific restriction endonuclease McrA
MFARRIARSPRRSTSGVARIRRDTYNTNSGFSQKGGWWEINALVVKRSGGICEAFVGGRRCTNKGREVHHIVALSRGGKTTMANLIHVCEGCHQARHNHLFRQNRK